MLSRRSALQLLAASTGATAAGSMIVSQPAYADSGSESCRFEFTGTPTVAVTTVNQTGNRRDQCSISVSGVNGNCPCGGSCHVRVRLLPGHSRIGYRRDRLDLILGGVGVEQSDLAQSGWLRHRSRGCAGHLLRQRACGDPLPLRRTDLRGRSELESDPYVHAVRPTTATAPHLPASRPAIRRRTASGAAPGVAGR